MISNFLFCLFLTWDRRQGPSTVRPRQEHPTQSKPSRGGFKRPCFYKPRVAKAPVSIPRTQNKTKKQNKRPMFPQVGPKPLASRNLWPKALGEPDLHIKTALTVSVQNLSEDNLFRMYIVFFYGQVRVINVYPNVLRVKFAYHVQYFKDFTVTYSSTHTVIKILDVSLCTVQCSSLLYHLALHASV